MEPMQELRDGRQRPRDGKVSETRLTVLGNQDVVLDALNISVGVH